MTLEDETGSANLVVWEKLFNTYRKEIIQSRLLMVSGRLQIADGVTHLVVYECFNLTALLQTLTATPQDELPLLNLAHPDEVITPYSYGQKQQTGKQPESVFHKGRNFK